MTETTSEVMRRKAREALAGCDLTPTHPSFYIEWDSHDRQWKISKVDDFGGE